MVSIRNVETIEGAADPSMVARNCRAFNSQDLILSAKAPDSGRQD
jgi:hypothetical protein